MPCIVSGPAISWVTVIIFRSPVALTCGLKATGVTAIDGIMVHDISDEGSLRCIGYVKYELEVILPANEYLRKFYEEAIQYLYYYGILLQILHQTSLHYKMVDLVALLHSDKTQEVDIVAAFELHAVHLHTLGRSLCLYDAI